MTVRRGNGGRKPVIHSSGEKHGGFSIQLDPRHERSRRLRHGRNKQRIAVRRPAMGPYLPPNRKLEVAFGAVPQIYQTHLSRKLIPTRNGEAEPARRNAPLQVRWLPRLSSCELVAAACDWVQPIED